MIIDANVILRYILKDNHSLSLNAKEVIENNNCIVPTEVVAEVVYVLQKVYEVPRVDVSTVLSKFSNVVEFEKANVILKALNFYENTKLDFVDCILASYNFVDKISVVTFDKKLNNFMKSFNV